MGAKWVQTGAKSVQTGAKSVQTGCKLFQCDCVQSWCKVGANWCKLGANSVQSRCKVGANWVQTRCSSLHAIAPKKFAPTLHRLCTEFAHNRTVYIRGDRGKGYRHSVTAGKHATVVYIYHVSK